MPVSTGERVDWLTGLIRKPESVRAYELPEIAQVVRT